MSERPPIIFGSEVCPICASPEPKTLHDCSVCKIPLFRFVHDGKEKLMIQPSVTLRQLDDARDRARLIHGEGWLTPKEKKE